MMSVAPVFIRSLALVRRSVTVSATDLTPLESFYLRIGTGPSPLIPRCEIGEISERKKPAGKQKGSAREKVDWKALDIVHPEAAGIDVGGSEHWVAVSPDRDPEPVRRFGCFTADLREMARWLLDKGVRSVAMQSTGVYWMPVFEVLEQHGLEVYLVNARHTKNLPGRKSDVQECQWLLKLHAFGLLNNSFQPTNEIRIARTLWRHRGNLVAEAGSAIQRMQKVLTEMNIQLGNVLSDLSGVSGMKIIGAILEGERDPWELAALARPEVKATPEDIAKSLEGNWREELLFVLEQEVELLPLLSGEDRRLRPATAQTSGVVRVHRGHPSAAPRAEAEGQERQSERSSIRFAHGVISYYGHRLGTNQRHGCSDGADRDCRGRCGSERYARPLRGSAPPHRTPV